MKSSKKALFSSVVALVLCFSMFIGTTMAWFTDSVSSGVNQILAGNLDIEVSYKDDATWKPLQNATSLFSTQKWEPGHTEYVVLKVENKGTLGFNYKMMVSPISENGGINVAGSPFKLSNYLVFGTVASATEPSYADRAAARDAVGTVTTLNQESLTKSGSILANGAAQYITLVVYMPESVGNEANYKTGTAAPSIELGIKVVATQLTAETDSFGPDYDDEAVNTPFYTVGAYYDYFEAVNVSGTADEDGNFTVEKTDANSGIVASASGTAAAGAQVNLLVTKTSTPEGNFGITVDEGHELNGYDIKVSGQAEGSLVQGKLYVGTGLENFKFYHNNQLMTVGTQGSLNNNEYCYNPGDGFVYFASTTFSPFQATYKAPVAAIGTAVYGTVQDAINATPKNATTATVITILKDVEGGAAFGYPDSDAAAGRNVTIDFAGHSYEFKTPGMGSTGTETQAMHLSHGNTMTLKNGTISVSKDTTAILRMIQNYCELTLDDMIVDCSNVKSSYNNSMCRGTLTVTGKTNFIASSATAKIFDVDGTYGKDVAVLFDSNYTGTTSGVIEYVASAGSHTSTLEIQAGTFTGKITSSGNTTPSITGGTFSSDPSEYVARGYYAQQNGADWTVEKIFNLGSGTPEDPFIISNSTQFYSINDGNNEGLCFKLANDITVDRYTRFVDNSPTTSNGGSGYAVIPYLTNCTIDGDGHTISVGRNYYMFGMLTNTTIKNVNFNVNGHNLTYMGTGIVFDNVDVSGKVQFAWNDGVYATYIYGGNNTLKDCANYTTMNGNWYSSVFVGYVIDNSYDAVLNFENCDNYGFLTCGYASLFIANPHYAKLTLNITNCHNYGTVHQVNDDEIFSPLTSVTWDGSPTYWKVTIDGQALSTWKDAQWSTFGGSYLTGSEDATLHISMNEDKTLTVTPAANAQVDHYVVAFEAYCAIAQGGSLKCVISESLPADVWTSTIKVCPFVDKTWVENNPTAVKGEANGFVTYTLGEDTYYLIPVAEEELDMYTTWGKVLDVSSVYVMAYSADGTLLAVSTLQ